MRGIQIIGLGGALPGQTYSNSQMADFVDTSDEWIQSRTGIRERHLCSGSEDACTLAVEASQRAIADAGIDRSEIGLLVVATCTPVYHMPSMACLIQEELGLPSGIPAFDINAACSGFVYGLSVVHALCAAWESSCGGAQQAKHRYALLVGAEQFSKFLDFSDRSTCVLFGDGAGAAVLRPSDTHTCVWHTAAAGDRQVLWVRSLGGNQLQAQAFPELTEAQAEVFRSEAYLHMEGQQVFKFAVQTIAEEIAELEKRSGISAEAVDYIVCHQANMRILAHVRRKLGLPEEKFYVNLDRVGNTSAASIPLALSEMKEQGLLRSGTRIFCVGFGAGLTWGSVYLEV